MRKRAEATDARAQAWNMTGVYSLICDSIKELDNLAVSSGQTDFLLKVADAFADRFGAGNPLFDREQFYRDAAPGSWAMEAEVV